MSDQGNKAFAQIMRDHLNPPKLEPSEVQVLQGEVRRLREALERINERARDCLDSGDYEDSFGAQVALKAILGFALSPQKGETLND